jgi:hypothetical protein
MNTTCSVNGQRQAATLNCEVINQGVNETKDDPSKSSRIGTAHETQNPASYMLMMMMIMYAFADFMLHGCS